MNELTDNLREEFKDKETRRIYVDDFLNSYIATQIKVLREQRGLTQAQLAALAEMKQERISVLEDVDYSSWTINVLRRLAEAFDLRLSVKFEDFGSFLREFEDFERGALERPSFKDDPQFQTSAILDNDWTIDEYEPDEPVYVFVGRTAPSASFLSPDDANSPVNPSTPFEHFLAGKTFNDFIPGDSTINLLDQPIA